MACTGIEYCKLAFVDTKDSATALVAELEKRFADDAPLETPLSIHLNGCPNSCARIQTADIGLKGQLLDGDTPGFQVHLGGGLSASHREEGGLGRTVRRPGEHAGGDAVGNVDPQAVGGEGVGGVRGGGGASRRLSTSGRELGGGEPL